MRQTSATAGMTRTQKRVVAPTFEEGDVVNVPTFKEGDAVKGSTRLGATMIDDVVVVGTVVSSTGIVEGVEVIGAPVEV
jgi:hypothetical protein